jgi:hypothetical protein
MNHKYGKGKGVPEHATKVYGGEATTSLILNFDTRGSWLIKSTLRPLYPRGKKTHVPIE